MMKKASRSLTRTARQRIKFYLFLLPAIIGFSVLTVYPFFKSFVTSFTDRLLFYPGDAEFVGFKNYIYLLTKYPKFWPALRNSALYAVFNVVFTNIIALLSAIALTRKIRGIKLYRTIFYVPSILPTVATTIMFASIFDPSYGFVNSFLLKLGFERSQLPLWLAGSDSALPTLIIMSMWGFGGKMIIFISGINSIPTGYYEAALIDGASPVRQFFSITLPLVTPSLIFNLIGAIIGGLQVFTEAFVGAGGVDFYVGVLYKMAYTGTYRMGLASAMAWIMFVIVAICVGLNMLISKYYVVYDN